MESKRSHKGTDNVLVNLGFEDAEDLMARASLALPLPAKNRWTFLSPSSTVRNGTTAPDQAHVSSS